MSIRERRPGVYQIRTYVGIKANGEADYAYSTFHGSKTEAKKEDLRLKAAVGTLPRTSEDRSVTLAEYSERWLNTFVKPNVRPSTLRMYSVLLRCAILPELGALRVSELSEEKIQRAFNAIAPRYSPKSLRLILNILQQVLKRARRARLIAVSPCEDIILPPMKGEHVRALTPDEAHRLLVVCGEVKQGDIIATALLTGLRRSELYKLTWDCVDFLRAQILVREGGSVSGVAKTAAGRRDVGMPSSLAALLLSLYQADEAKRKAKPDWNPKRLVFPTSVGTARIDMSMKPHLDAALKTAGIDIPGFRFHDLRHSHGSLLARAGASLPAIQKRLGHKNLQTTVGTYLHSGGDEDAGLAALLQEVTGPGIQH